MKPIHKEDVLAVLKSVNDPELRMNVVDLGLIYEVKISDTNDVEVAMTVTTPGCPVIDKFLQQAHEYVESLADVGKVTIRLTFSPPWTPERIRPELRAAMGL